MGIPESMEPIFETKVIVIGIQKKKQAQVSMAVLYERIEGMQVSSRMPSL